VGWAAPAQQRLGADNPAHGEIYERLVIEIKFGAPDAP
jgi:hypothetical protein